MSSNHGKKVLNSIDIWWTQNLRVQHIELVYLRYFYELIWVYIIFIFFSIFFYIQIILNQSYLSKYNTLMYNLLLDVLNITAILVGMPYLWDNMMYIQCWCVAYHRLVYLSRNKQSELIGSKQQSASFQEYCKALVDIVQGN